MVPGDLPRRREEAARVVLGVDPALDGVAARNDLLLGQRQALAGGDAQLLGHEVDAVDELGHRVLDLQARVHLQEVELAVAIDELDGAGVDVADRLRRGHRRLAHARARRGVDDRRRRLLDDLLVAALDRALALAEVDDVAVRVGEHLDLDVARLLEVALEKDRVVAERALRGALRGVERGAQLLLVAGDAHADATAARARLDEHRVADAPRRRRRFRRCRRAHPLPGHDRHARVAHALARGHLLAHRRHRVGRRADEDDAVAPRMPARTAGSR